jgi:sugar O-acyltransferase (sialic acid O-acetyltransferase NeuD family)
MAKVGIFGSSGHARDIASIIKERDSNCVVQFIEPAEEAELVEKLANEGYKFIIGIGDNKIRKKVAEKYPHLTWENVISLRAHIPVDARFGTGLFIGFGTYISHSVEVNDHAIIHCNTVIGHETVIEKFAQIAPGVCIGGNGVTLKEGTFIGANATILNKALIIGEWSMVSLASVVTDNIPPGVLHQTVHKKVVLGMAT